MTDIDVFFTKLKESIEAHSSDLKKGELFGSEYLKGKVFSQGFRIDLSEDLRITQSEMSKQIQAELVDKLSESTGKEYIITQSPSPERQ